MTDQTIPGDDGPLSASKRSDAVETFSVELGTGDRAGGAGTRGGAISGRAVTINRPVEEVFAAFRDFSRLPGFMENVESITVLDHKRSHWVVKAPGGRTVEWDARITAEMPDRLIEWTSEEGADVPNSGRVTFQPVEGRGTVVTATILYAPPGGVVGKIVAKMFQREPAIQSRRDLARFKQLLETGEVATPAMNPRQYEEMGL